MISRLVTVGLQVESIVATCEYVLLKVTHSVIIQIERLDEGE